MGNLNHIPNTNCNDCQAQVGQCQTHAECDDATGFCKLFNQVDGYSCDDGDATTKNDVCVQGKCTGEALIETCKVDSDCIPDTNYCQAPGGGLCKNNRCYYTSQPVGTVCPHGYCDKESKCTNIVVEGYGQSKTKIGTLFGHMFMVLLQRIAKLIFMTFNGLMVDWEALMLTMKVVTSVVKI